MGDIQKLAGSEVSPSAVARDGNRWRPAASRWGPQRKLLKLRGFDLKVRFDGSIARLLGLGLGLVVGLGLAELTSTLVTALHVGSERLLAGFDALSGVSHARAPEKSAD